MNAQQLDAAITQLYPNAYNLINFRLAETNGVASITEWNAASIGAPQPSSFDLARGWFLYSQRNAYGRMALGMVKALRAKVPEVAGVAGGEQIPEAPLYVLLIEIASNNNPTRTQSVKDERTKWINKKAQVDAVALSASPTEQEYLTKADTLNAITY